MIFFYHVINYGLLTSEPEIDLIFLLNLVNSNLPRDFSRQSSELGEIAGKGSKSCNQGLPRLDNQAYSKNISRWPLSGLWEILTIFSGNV